MDSFSSHLLYSVLDVFFCSWYSSVAHICSLTSAWRSYTRAFSGFFWVHSDLRCSCCWESPISGSFHGLWCSWHHWWIHCSKRWLVHPSFRPKLDSLEISRSMKEFHEGWNPWRDCQSHWVLLQFIWHLGWLWGLNAIWYRNLSFRDQEKPWLKYLMRVWCLKLLEVFLIETAMYTDGSVLYDWISLNRDQRINCSQEVTIPILPPFMHVVSSLHPAFQCKYTHNHTLFSINYPLPLYPYHYFS